VKRYYDENSRMVTVGRGLLKGNSGIRLKICEEIRDVSVWTAGLRPVFHTRSTVIFKLLISFTLIDLHLENMDMQF
jgi:hypothetical protein